MARNFNHVLKAIKAIAPEELKNVLESSAPSYWAPEIRWKKLAEYVNKYVFPNSQDTNSIKIFALLCNCSEEQMKERFKKDGF